MSSEFIVQSWTLGNFSKIAGGSGIEASKGMGERRKLQPPAAGFRGQSPGWKLTCNQRYSCFLLPSEWEIFSLLGRNSFLPGMNNDGWPVDNGNHSWRGAISFSALTSSYRDAELLLLTKVLHDIVGLLLSSFVHNENRQYSRYVYKQSPCRNSTFLIILVYKANDFHQFPHGYWHNYVPSLIVGILIWSQRTQGVCFVSASQALSSESVY